MWMKKELKGNALLIWEFNLACYIWELVVKWLHANNANELGIFWQDVGMVLEEFDKANPMCRRILVVTQTIPVPPTTEPHRTKQPLTTTTLVPPAMKSGNKKQPSMTYEIPPITSVIKSWPWYNQLPPPVLYTHPPDLSRSAQIPTRSGQIWPVSSGNES